MSSNVTPARVRFAPSPTGYLHVGSIRSGLFNWLWARHTGGSFVLRIEDTDRNRLVPDAIEQIMRTHAALGITPDEGPGIGGAYGPYLQSERLDIYHEHAHTLLQSGALYRCWCTPERLTRLREAAQSSGVAFMYDRFCLDPANQQTPEVPHVLRFRIPEGQNVVAWDDVVRGRLEFARHTLDDFVALKADGYPTYHFANVVDDHLMHITHVMRADEWIPSTPKHLLLFAAFSWTPPIFAHLPAVQGPDGHKKLSKRDGAQSVEEYLEEGYLPEALRSFLASLGWNDGTTQEVYSTPELIEKFSLERIQKSPARFDRNRLTWMNGLMIRQMAPQELLSRLDTFWPPQANDYTPEYKQSVLMLVQDRLKILSELPALSGFFFSDPTDEQLRTLLPVQKIGTKLAGQWLTATISMLEEHFTQTHTFNEVALEAFFRDHIISALKVEKSGQLFMLVRVAISGETATPGLFETMAVLGKDKVLKRLQEANKVIQSQL